MTNKEHYKEQILDIVCDGKGFAFDKTTGKMSTCTLTHCYKCAFINRQDPFGCDRVKREWCNKEYVEPYPFNKGELVEVSDDKEQWQLHYFSHIDDCGNFRTYLNEKPSKNTNGTFTWKYCQKYGTLGGLINED